jgi:hypothetical protein
VKTFEECVNETLRYGFTDGPLVNKTRIEQWLNEGQLQVARNVDSMVFQAVEEKTMTVGTYKYALPTGFIRMASILYPLVAVRLKPMNLQNFDSLMSAREANLGEGTGIEGPPVAYTIWNKELWLFPTPSSADKLELRYYKKPARLTGVEVPILEEDYLHLLVDYALWRCYRAEDDPEMATAHETQYEKDLAKYEADVQNLQDDRPFQLSGTWGLPL